MIEVPHILSEDNIDNVKNKLCEIYAARQMELLSANPKFEVEWIVKNAFKKGWDKRGEQVDELQFQNRVLTDILTHSMTPDYLSTLKQTYINQDSYDKELSKISLQITKLEKEKTVYKRKISKAVQHRNKMTELHKAHLQHKVLNE